MGIRNVFSRLSLGWLGEDKQPSKSAVRNRLCRFEEFESRRQMAADVPPIHVGAVYYDPASGLDTEPNTVHVTFEGGAANSEMTRLVIEGNKDGGDLSFNDAMFDTKDGGFGAYGWNDFHLVSSAGFQVAKATVEDGGTRLTLDFKGFKAGMTLVFTIDVDQVLFIAQPAPHPEDVEVDAVDEGAEFQRSHFITTFVAPHYEDLTSSVLFWDKFTKNFADAATAAGTTLELPPDRYIFPTDKSVLTAGAVDQKQQVPKPNSLSGVVFADYNLNNLQDAGDTGISGVTLQLWEHNGNTYVATNRTTVTNAQGAYNFDKLGIGTFKVVEVQPGGWLSVGSRPGKVDGQTRGVSETVDVLSQIDLLGGENSVRNDFAEYVPGSIAGFVGIDCEHNMDPPPIAGVKIELLNSSGQVIATTFTDSNGNYKFSTLRPGTYGVREYTPSGYFDGDEEAGSAGGTASDDLITNIVLGMGIDAVHYDFCELLPVSIAGSVHSNPTGDCDDVENSQPIAGVTIQLLNAAGQVLTTTTTDSMGHYKFENLAPGTYGVRELQPAGYFDGNEMAGSADGDVSNDLITHIVLISGTHAVEYNFCEMPPASIAGSVHSNPTGDCEDVENSQPIAGVTIQLLNASGQVVATTTTDMMGHYQFTNLAPGTYSVRELQPAGYFDGGEMAGSAGGSVSNDLISSILLLGGTNAVDYAFCEMPPASIAGSVHYNPTGDCEDVENSRPIAGVSIQLLNASGQIVATTTTNAMGHYQFTNLAPGTYSVRELQPAGYFDGQEMAGTAGGDVSNDLISRVVLVGGFNAVEYNFCEIPPAELCGFVYVDLNNNGSKDPGEAGIAGVTLNLLNAAGIATGVTTVTDSTGAYCFTNLRPGTYGVSENQPSQYFDGLDSAGDAGGTAQNPGDIIVGATLTGGQHAENYNFGELPPASIAGSVHYNPSGDCMDEENARPLAGVTIELLNAVGQVIDTTQTDMHGGYRFDHLAPGTYGVREMQPAAYFDGDEMAGTAGGNAADDLITQIVLGAGVAGVEYNFCEIPPAMLSGFVFQDGPPIVLEFEGQQPDVPAVRDGKLTSDDTRLRGVLLQLVDGQTGRAILGSEALPGMYAANEPITTLTDAQGHYQFRGLKGGIYGVYYVMPAGYLPGIDTAGSTGGEVISPWSDIDPALIAGLVVQPEDDAIIAIALPNAGASTENNFSVVTTTFLPPQQIILPPPGDQPPPPPPPIFVAPLIETIAPLRPGFQIQTPPQIIRFTGALYTWHLSIVDAGNPRGSQDGEALVQLTSMRSGQTNPWGDETASEGEFILPYDNRRGGKAGTYRLKFGIKNAFPVSGDFNGDGVYEIGVFKDGKWFIDLNDNGVWDDGDLFAKLGHHGDRPVTGDWDGDGKSDIGIYGPAWSGDPRALAYEPGLPDPANENLNVPKNIPRPSHKTPIDQRKLQVGSAGTPRSDLIDHVFLYGMPGDWPTVGDWNGDGIATVAVFRDGLWYRDIDGNGKWSQSDEKSNIGLPGDIPVVGDFDGDGFADLGVFRNGSWYIDTNHNGQIDSTDMVFQLGGPGDQPIVGDWNGDGRDDPGIYRAAG